MRFDSLDSGKGQCNQTIRVVLGTARGKFCKDHLQCYVQPSLRIKAFAMQCHLCEGNSHRAGATAQWQSTGPACKWPFVRVLSILKEETPGCKAHRLSQNHRYTGPSAHHSLLHAPRQPPHFKGHGLLPEKYKVDLDTESATGCQSYPC